MKNYIKYSAFIGVIILGLANSSSHPTSGTGGYTGAPGDSTCSSCHSGSSPITGTVSINGLPSVINTGDTYTLTVTLNSAAAIRGGFQLLALTGTNTNAGSMVVVDANTTFVKIGGGKNYFGHQPAQMFPASDELSFDVLWTAPPSIGSNPIIKFYAVAALANGSGSGGDKIVFTNQTIPITGSSQPLAVNVTNPVNPTCSNSNNGRATANASGGSGTYTYSWSSGSTSMTATNLSGGTSFVTVNDGTSQIVGQVDLVAPNQLTAIASSTAACQGQNNGAATVFANGGTGNLTYMWSNGSTLPSISNLASGNYSVTVRDANLCTTTASTTVSTSPTIVLTPSIINAPCNGASGGSILMSVSGGSGPFSYSWSNGQSGNPAINLTAGIYTVTVSDAAGCTKVGSYTVTQPPSLNVSVTSSSNVSCFGGNNGAASINISGGSPGYSYVWSNGATGSGNNSSISGLTAGTYTVTVTDFLDCEKTLNVTITQAPTINIESTVENISCFGQTNGNITVSPAGGTGTYTYVWSNGNTTNSIVNLSVGNYTVTVKDANQCTNTKSHAISQPNQLTATANLLSPIVCSGATTGSLQAIPTGGNSTFNYLWSNGGTTATIGNLGANTYTVTVTDNRGCITTASKEITQPSPFQTMIINSTPATCIGATNGSITVQASNGQSPYTYAWQNGQSGPTLSNVASGAYILTITDGVGCTSLRVFDVLANNGFFLEAGAVDQVTCFGGSNGVASVIPQIGLTYLWSDGRTGSAVNNLRADTISVVGTDSQGCKSQERTFIITEPDKLAPFGVTFRDVLCQNEAFGYIDIDSLIGGTGLINFSWTTLDTTLNLDALKEDTLTIGSHTLSLKDINNCIENYTYTISKAPIISIDSVFFQNPACHNTSDGKIELILSGGYKNREVLWNTGETMDSLYNLQAGQYTITVRDSALCLLQDTFILIQPDSLFATSIVLNETEAGKNDGKISLSVVGGTEPFTISWDNGDTTFVIDSLVPKIYNYQITDGRGCVFSGFEIVAGGGCDLGASISVVKPTCSDSNDGEINLTIPGNILDYKLQLVRNGAISTLPLTNLTIGNYTLVIENSAGCIAAFQNIDLSPLSPKMTFVNFTEIRPTNSSSQNGTLTANISGGTLPLTYNWSKNNITILGNTSTQNGLSIGTYALEVIDSLGCQLLVSDYILQSSSASDDIRLNQLSIFPNPASNEITLRFDGSMFIDKILVSDAQGRTQPFVQSKLQDGLLKINLEQLSSGMYFITIQSGKNKVVKKLAVTYE